MTQSPKILSIGMLDTDYIKMIAGEPISAACRERLDSTDPHTFRYLEKQLARYRYSDLNQEQRDDILCNIGSTVGLLTAADLEDINDRLRYTGHLFLTDAERRQIFNWLQDEWGICLTPGETETCPKGR